MKKSALAIIFITITYGALFAQQNQPQKGSPYRDGSCKTVKPLCPKHVLYHETHSNFSFLTFNSINWEGTMVCRQQFMLTGRLGGIYYNFVKLRSAGAVAGLNFLLGGGKWLIDVGFGGTYQYVYKNFESPQGRFSDNVHLTGVNVHVGTRYEIEESFFFKIVFDPMYVIMGKDEIPLMKSAFQPVAGIGLGYTFNH